VTVAKATPRVTVSRRDATVKRGRTAVFTVRTSATGVKASGRVTVRVGGTSKTVRVNRFGTATVRLKMSASVKPGRKTVRVLYRGDRHLTEARATTTRIRVSR
jgi:hypothetical protein